MQKVKNEMGNCKLIRGETRKTTKNLEIFFWKNPGIFFSLQINVYLAQGFWATWYRSFEGVLTLSPHEWPLPYICLVLNIQPRCLTKIGLVPMILEEGTYKFKFFSPKTFIGNFIFISYFLYYFNNDADLCHYSDLQMQIIQLKPKP